MENFTIHFSIGQSVTINASNYFNALVLAVSDRIHFGKDLKVDYITDEKQVRIDTGCAMNLGKRILSK